MGTRSYFVTFVKINHSAAYVGFLSFLFFYLLELYVIMQLLTVFLYIINFTSAEYVKS